VLPTRMSLVLLLLALLCGVWLQVVTLQAATWQSLVCRFCVTVGSSAGHPWGPHSSAQQWT
jgi:hypothetical protein